MVKLSPIKMFSEVTLLFSKNIKSESKIVLQLFLQICVVAQKTSQSFHLFVYLFVQLLTFRYFSLFPKYNITPPFPPPIWVYGREERGPPFSTFSFVEDQNLSFLFFLSEQYRTDPTRLASAREGARTHATLRACAQK